MHAPRERIRVHARVLAKAHIFLHHRCRGLACYVFPSSSTAACLVLKGKTSVTICIPTWAEKNMERRAGEDWKGRGLALICANNFAELDCSVLSPEDKTSTISYQLGLKRIRRKRVGEDWKGRGAGSQNTICANNFACLALTGGSGRRRCRPRPSRTCTSAPSCLSRAWP